MFDALSSKLSKVFSVLSRKTNLTESNIADSLIDVRRALLGSDVSFEVVEQFIKDVKSECIGQKVFENVSPGQQAVKIVYDKLVGILGGECESLCDRNPLKIMMVGLHGAGKTTTTAKLANFLKKSGKSPALVACDIYRPAAIEQLMLLGEQVGVPVFSKGNASVEEIGKEALKWFGKSGCDVLIFDTAGRLQIDNKLIDEAINLRDIVKPDETLLVADSALGSEAVNIAKEFNAKLNLTGLVLTKLDGDTKGGAALSMKHATGVSIKFSAIGEKIDDFEMFYPDRMANRILGMGDIVSLVEKAQEHVDDAEVESMNKRLLSKDFNFEDLKNQFNQLKKIGTISSIAKWLPGGMSSMLEAQDGEMKKMDALINSMTIKERRQPALLSSTHRKMRIVKGSGLTVSDFNKLVKRFQMAKKTANKLNKMDKNQMDDMLKTLSNM